MPDQAADLLTTAAQKLREAATAATHDGRTTWQLGNTLGTKTAVVLDDPDTPTVLIETYAERLEKVNAYLALVGPATGLVVAGWLETAAATYGHLTNANRDAALAVARVVLGPDGQQ